MSENRKMNNGLSRFDEERKNRMAVEDMYCTIKFESLKSSMQQLDLDMMAQKERKGRSAVGIAAASSGFGAANWGALGNGVWDKTTKSSFKTRTERLGRLE